MTGNAANALGVARVTAVGGTKAYDGIAQIAPESGGSREVRVFSSVENSNAYYLQVMWME